MPEIIVTAETEEDYADFARLVREYVAWCRTRYADDIEVVEGAFGHQALESELLILASAYGPPKGRTFLARSEGEALGCVAYRRLSDDICEMKRLFVRPGAAGKGTGKRLCMALLDAARDDGFLLMRLDTGTRMTEAITLYEDLGFRRCAAYQEYPQPIMRHIIFMELDLRPPMPPLR